MVRPSPTKLTFQISLTINLQQLLKNKRKYLSFTWTFLWVPKTQNSKLLFLCPSNKSEIENKISSLDSNKSVEPNSIPTKMLMLLKYNISSQLTDISQPANIGPQDVRRMSPSNVPRTYPKDPIWPSRRCPNLTSWGRPEMTSRGRLNLTFKGRSWEVDSGRPQNVLRTSSRRPSEYSNFDV